MECNQTKCLRIYTYDYSDLQICSLFPKDESQAIPNSNKCPYYCEKFFDYELKKEFYKHEDVEWISTDFSDFNSKFYNGLFAGVSTEGREHQNWESDHTDTDNIVCPYCDYEFEHPDNIYEEGEEEVECSHCDKTFTCNTEAKYTYTTNKLEEDEE